MTDQAQIDALRDIDLTPRGLLIDGQSLAASDGATLDVISPLNGRVLTTTAAGTAGDRRREPPGVVRSPCTTGSRVALGSVNVAVGKQKRERMSSSR